MLEKSSNMSDICQKMKQIRVQLALYTHFSWALKTQVSGTPTHPDASLK